MIKTWKPNDEIFPEVETEQNIVINGNKFTSTIHINDKLYICMLIFTLYQKRSVEIIPVIYHLKIVL